MSSQSKMFDQAVALIDAANAEDPHIETADGKEWPKELLYSQRMSDMLRRYAPEADEAQRLAIRAQHIQRWKSPRSDYPMDRNGYMQWRTQLYKFHAEIAGRLLAQAGYGEDVIERVRQAVGKRALKLNPDDTHALCNRAELRIRASLFAEAGRDLRRAIDLDPRGEDPAAMRARALVAVIDDLIKRSTR